MLSDEKRQELEQQIAEAGEVLPRLWRAMYNGLIEEGFSEWQAMSLLRTWIAKPLGDD